MTTNKDALDGLKTLRLAVKAEYFNQIKAGTKRFEYRLRNEYWDKRLHRKHYDRVVITLGYPKADDTDKIMTFYYMGYWLKSITHKHFGDSPVDVYAIDLKYPTD